MHSITLPRIFSLSMTALLLSVATQSTAQAQAGHLDHTFANKGIFAITSVNASANTVAIQSDGKIVIAGGGISGGKFFDALIRLNSDGSLDPTFGSGGIANLVPPGNPYAIFGFFDVAIQSDGKIVAAGETVLAPTINVQVARVDKNGKLDATFGTGGFTTSNAIPFRSSGALALQPDGEILVASGDSSSSSVLARFTTSGQLDSTFGSDGLVNLATPSPTQIAVQSADGKILVASGTQAKLVFQAHPTAAAGAISRYNADGTLDTTFGASGRVASIASASALLLQSDGKIVAAGALTSKLNAPPANTDVGFGIVRYNADGTPDTAFGTGGVAIADFGANGPDSGAFAVAIQSNGDLVAAGAAAGAVSANNITSAFGLVRFTSTGQLDATFGLGGRVMTNVAPGQYSVASSMAIQADGKIVAAGNSEFHTGSQVAFVTRYLGQ